MKRICTLILAAGLVFGAATGASAIDFKAKGQWLMGFSAGTDSLVSKTRTGNNGKVKADTNDKFAAQQRIRLQLDAVASEALSGTVFFEMGDTTWGNNASGGALGADGRIVEVKNAYIDWAIPQTDAKVRMGIQGLALPNVAGGSAVMDTDVAAVVTSYKFNENVSLTALWARPFNDNFDGNDARYNGNTNDRNYLDNMDLFAVTLPVKLDGFGITPWVMYGMMGKNTTTSYDGVNADYDNHSVRDGNPGFTLFPYPVGASINGDADTVGYGGTSKAYGSMFWAGLPMTLTMFDPLNVELDINYGYVESMGRYSVQKGQGGDFVRGSMGRQGWLAKALVEYKMDWATPGLFGWYATGDDNSVKNGSERMPSIVPVGNMTSFMGDGNMGWFRQDYGVDYAGTWGIGAQLKDMSFLEDLKHTFRIAYWGGTNSTSMVKYMANAYSWNDATGTQATVPYLTTNDGLVEFNLVNSYKIYQNLEMNLELDYLVNCMDNSTWKKAQNPSSFSKQDMFQAKVVFAYSF